MGTKVVSQFSVRLVRSASLLARVVSEPLTYTGRSKPSTGLRPVVSISVPTNGCHRLRATPSTVVAHDVVYSTILSTHRCAPLHVFVGPHRRW